MTDDIKAEIAAAMAIITEAATTFKPGDTVIFTQPIRADMMLYDMYPMGSTIFEVGDKATIVSINPSYPGGLIYQVDKGCPTLPEFWWVRGEWIKKVQP